MQISPLPIVLVAALVLLLLFSRKKAVASTQVAAPSPSRPIDTAPPIKSKPITIGYIPKGTQVVVDGTLTGNKGQGDITEFVIHDNLLTHNAIDTSNMICPWHNPLDNAPAKPCYPIQCIGARIGGLGRCLSPSGNSCPNEACS
jgi:hypothetical protein